MRCPVVANPKLPCMKSTSLSRFVLSICINVFASPLLSLELAGLVHAQSIFATSHRCFCLRQDCLHLQKLSLSSLSMYVSVSLFLYILISGFSTEIYLLQNGLLGLSHSLLRPSWNCCFHSTTLKVLFFSTCILK